MKKVYLSIALLMPFALIADQSDKNEEPAVTKTVREDTAKMIDQLNLEIDGADYVGHDPDRILPNLDEDDFFGDMLDKMIEVGAVSEEIKMHPMPFWKAWLLRIGSSALAKIDTFKKFIHRRYQNVKDIVVVAWSKVTGKDSAESTDDTQKKDPGYQKIS